MSTPIVILAGLITLCEQNGLKPTTISVGDAKEELSKLKNATVTNGVDDVKTVRRATDNALCYNFDFFEAISAVCDQKNKDMLDRRFDKDFELYVLKERALDAWALANFSKPHCKLSVCCDYENVKAFLLHQHKIINALKSGVGVEST